MSWAQRNFIDGCAAAIEAAGLREHLESELMSCGGKTGGGAAPSAGSGSCDVSCVDKTFTAGSREGESVCAFDQCGSATPFVGLDTFGCSNQVVFWGGNCCNVNTCPPKK